MEDDQRNTIMRVTDQEMEKLADVCNRYPVVEMSYKLNQDSYLVDEAVVLNVTLTRPDDDEESLAVFNEPVYAQYFP